MGLPYRERGAAVVAGRFAASGGAGPHRAVQPRRWRLRGPGQPHPDPVLGRRPGFPPRLPARRHRVPRPCRRETVERAAGRRRSAVRAVAVARPELLSLGRGRDLRARRGRQHRLEQARHAEQHQSMVLAACARIHRNPRSGGDGGRTRPAIGRRSAATRRGRGRRPPPLAGDGRPLGRSAGRRGRGAEAAVVFRRLRGRARAVAAQSVARLRPSSVRQTRDDVVSARFRSVLRLVVAAGRGVVLAGRRPAGRRGSSAA
jgi:hypothetical protein